MKDSITEIGKAEPFRTSDGRAERVTGDAATIG
jgi:hypothetical protein